MSQELLHDNSIRVTEYNLIDFTFAIADLGAKGFVPTLLNGSHPEGGLGSWYTCVMVTRDAYRIDKGGVHLNTPTETALKAPTTPLAEQSNTPTLAKYETKATESVTNPVKTTRTTTKKTT